MKSNDLCVKAARMQSTRTNPEISTLWLGGENHSTNHEAMLIS